MYGMDLLKIYLIQINVKKTQLSSNLKDLKIMCLSRVRRKSIKVFNKIVLD